MRTIRVEDDLSKIQLFTLRRKVRSGSGRILKISDRFCPVQLQAYFVVHVLQTFQVHEIQILNPIQE